MAKSNNKISKAPPPITPLPTNTPTNTSHVFDTEVKGKTNWKYWKHLSNVELWQALLLSLNINPPGNGWLIDNAPGRTGDIPYKYLDSQGLTEEFVSRWKLIKNKLEHIYNMAQLEPTIELTNFISLSFFSKLAVEFEWENLPDELLKLTIDESPKHKTIDKKNNAWDIVDARDPTPAQPWFTPARYFARQLVLEDSTLLIKRNLLAGKVSDSLFAAKIFGRKKNRKLDGGTILKAFTNVTLG